VLELADCRLEGPTPPIEVQVHCLVLVVTEEVEPDYCVGTIAEVVEQCIHDVQEFELPGMRDEYLGCLDADPSDSISQ
jgi:hypothetical protein